MPELSYDVVGATRPDQEAWAERPAGYRRYERTVRVGRGTPDWEAVSAGVLDWQVKTRSGFTVLPVGGDDYRLTARVGPVTVTEPIRVIAVVDQPARRGFSYGTLAGHPVSGEEAFIAHRSADGLVWLTIRSLTRPAAGKWGWAFPALLVAQRVYRRRYLRSMNGSAA
ncbi:DUF1990 family protein [Actinoplanes sp. M2I2]|uniref:DUF1990 family protein n=1 Tax=Actinoplanes sp. M2I2 TaxID=1734444 RepID=UPI0020223A9E|nr:DUF1990 domain-containing protein [Actinoplanes sp. M2I2]